MRVAESKKNEVEEISDCNENMESVIAEALQKYGLISAPFLQKKCKITHNAAKKAVEKG